MFHPSFSDYKANKLYWVDAQLNYIGKSNLDGTSRKKIDETVSHPFSLVVYDDHIYWTEWGSNSVKMTSILSWKNATVRSGLNSPKDIIVSDVLCSDGSRISRSGGVDLRRGRFSVKMYAK